MKCQLVGRSPERETRIHYRAVCSTLVQSAPRLIAISMECELTCGEHAVLLIAAADVKAEALQPAASVQIRGWCVVFEDALICVAARRDLQAVLIHGSGVAALRVLQRGARDDGDGEGCLAVRVGGTCASMPTLAGIAISRALEIEVQPSGIRQRDRVVPGVRVPVEGLRVFHVPA